MIAEIGHLLLIISTALAILLAVVPLYGTVKDNLYLRSYTPVLSGAMALALLGAISCLGWGFLNDDFSISYVANHSNTQLAWYYKIAAVWGSHEGSMLMWVMLIALWAALIALNPKYTDKAFIARQQAVLGMIVTGFNLFLLFTSNPFARNLPNIPIEGRDLNPILQDIGLILHPPLLFLGYVGLTITFAAAMAALLGGKLTRAHAGYLRPWVLIAWVFLTGGNAFGSWWAYNELGWGGWWFWDPVENSSFIPWLVATALLHSVIVTEKRDGLQLTTLLLCLLAFSLSLLGTFLVRSGIVQSVHAFASDPTRGMSILSLLVIFAAGALLLFALRGEQFRQPLDFSLKSKDSLMLMGIAVLVVTALSVLLGTFYPLLFELAGLGTISVGAPYFNSIFVPLTFVTVLLMGITPMLQWRRDKQLRTQPLILLALVSITLATVLCSQHKDPLNHFLWLGTASAIWLLGCLALNLLLDKGRLSCRRSGMYLAHFGAAIAIIGATAVSNYEEEAMLRMGPGQGKPLGDFIFVYEATEQVTTPAYTALQARIAVLDSEEQPQGYIFPQRQTFKTNGMQMSQAGIDHGFLRDLYVSKGVQLSDTEYLIRIAIKPLASWIWLGGGLMMLGGLLCTLPRRRRQPVEISESSTTTNHTVDPGMKQLIRKVSVGLMAALVIGVLFIATAEAANLTNGDVLYTPAQKKDLGFEIARELRCPMSVNQSLFDSNAQIANELKGHIFRLLDEGKTKDDIIDYLTARYGEKIRYSPGLSGGTALLWFGPGLLLLLAVGTCVVFVRRAKTSPLNHSENPRNTR